MEHDGHVGELLRLLDELKVADNTIVVYTTDNGAMVSWWPNAATTPFRSEKATTWEGGVRVPTASSTTGVRYGMLAATAVIASVSYGQKWGDREDSGALSLGAKRVF